MSREADPVGPAGGSALSAAGARGVHGNDQHRVAASRRPRTRRARGATTPVLIVAVLAATVSGCGGGTVPAPGTVTATAQLAPGTASDGAQSGGQSGAQSGGQSGVAPGGGSDGSIDEPTTQDKAYASLAERGAELAEAYPRPLSPLALTGDLTEVTLTGSATSEIKEAIVARRFRLAVTLPTTSTKGVVTLPDGTARPVTLVSAARSFALLRNPSAPVAGGLTRGPQKIAPATSEPAAPKAAAPEPATPQPAAPKAATPEPATPDPALESALVTAARLTTVAASTPYGPMRVPVWAFTVKGATGAINGPALEAVDRGVGAPTITTTASLIAHRRTLMIERARAAGSPSGATRQITIVAGMGACDAPPIVEVVEHEHVVVVSVTTDSEPTSQTCTSQGIYVELPLTLSANLGPGRLLVDAASGAPILLNPTTEPAAPRA